MKKLLPVLMVSGVFLGSAGESFAQSGNRYLTGNQIQHLLDGSRVNLDGGSSCSSGRNSNHKIEFLPDGGLTSHWNKFCTRNLPGRACLFIGACAE